MIGKGVMVYKDGRREDIVIDEIWHYYANPDEIALIEFHTDTDTYQYKRDINEKEYAVSSRPVHYYMASYSFYNVSKGEYVVNDIDHIEIPDNLLN